MHGMVHGKKDCSFLKMPTNHTLGLVGVVRIVAGPDEGPATTNMAGAT